LAARPARDLAGLDVAAAHEFVEERVERLIGDLRDPAAEDARGLPRGLTLRHGLV
jgi:hypothetical protein